VNLTKTQIDWMTTPQCSDGGAYPLYVNQPYIDVISLDIYNKGFTSDVKPYYDWLDSNRAKPEQQFALVPGTHYVVGQYSAASQAALLPAYFNYADNQNLNCNLPLGDRGVTGRFDGCRVWIVLGWLGPNYSEGNWQYKGERDPSSGPIANVWQSRVAIPIRPDLANQVPPADLVPALVTPVLY
jgi:hypothetical protein